MLEKDPSMRTQIVQLLGTLAASLPAPTVLKPLGRPSLLDADEFVLRASTLELPVSDLVLRLQSYANDKNWEPNPSASRRKILRDFTRVSDPSVWGAALATLSAGPVTPDPYTEGILARGKQVSASGESPTVKRAGLGEPESKEGGYKKADPE